MKKGFRIIFVLLIIVIGICLDSCGGNIDTSALFDNALVSIKDIDSADINMIISYGLCEEHNEKTTDIKEVMDCKIKTTNNPAITYTQATDTTTYDDKSIAYDITSYSVESGDVLISYSKSEGGDEDEKNAYNDGKWYKSTSEATGGQLKAQMSLIKTCAKYEKNFSYDKKEKVNKVKCHKVTGTISGKSIYEALGELGSEDTNNLLNAYSGSEDDEVKVEMWFSVKTGEPVKIKLNLKSLMESMIKNEDYGEDYSYSVNDYYIELIYNSFNTVGIIEVPDEVIEGAISTEESIPDDEEYMKYFENIDLESIGLRLDNISNWSEEDWEKAKEKLYEYYDIED